MLCSQRVDPWHATEFRRIAAFRSVAVGRVARRAVTRKSSVPRGVCAEFILRLPINLVLVRRFDTARRSLETVAVGTCRPSEMLKAVEARTQIREDEYAGLLKWCCEGDVVTCNGHADDHPAALLVPGGLQGRLLVGPLNSTSGPAAL